MKRKMAFFLCTVLLLGLCACNSQPAVKVPDDDAPKTNPPTTLKILKVLAIGNSFSVDAMEHLYAVAKAEGVEEVVLGNLYIGGCTIATHASNAQSNAAKYRYYKNTDGQWTQTEGYTLLSGLQDEQWDLITLQQGSASSGQVETYSASLDKLIAYVQDNCPEAKLGWHMTWAYQSDSTHNAFPNYGNNQQAMYLGIINAVQVKIVTNDAFDVVLPVGTAIQNARTSYLGDNLTRDGYHLNDMGRLIASYTWYATLDGQKLNTLNLTKVTNMLTLTDADKAVVVEAINAAVANPFAVTDSNQKTK